MTIIDLAIILSAWFFLLSLCILLISQPTPPTYEPGSEFESLRKKRKLSSIFEEDETHTD
jgi:hypothetical protein